MENCATCSIGSVSIGVDTGTLRSVSPSTPNPGPDVVLTSPVLARVGQAVSHSVLSSSRVAAALTSNGICFDVGPFKCRVRSCWEQLADPLRSLYADMGLREATAVEDVVFDIDANIGRKRHNIFGRLDAEFSVAGFPPLPELPFEQVHPLFEWGLNWAVATLSGTSIVIHAAIVERNGHAIVLPGEPGAGKSTLSAALSLSGWRLLSDELTVIDLDSLLAVPLPRPISLKGRSIDVIKLRFPNAWLTAPVTETRKGAIAYVRPPTDAVVRSRERVPVASVMFPVFQNGVPLSCEDVMPAAALSRLLTNTFNVGLLGSAGFRALTSIVANSKNIEMAYSDLTEALDWIDRNLP